MGFNPFLDSDEGGGGFTPTDGQLAAMNSGITAEKLTNDETNISNNKSAIEGQQNATTDTVPGNGYAIINGIRLYVSPTAPTGNIPDGSIGVGW